MRAILRLYKNINILSIDIVAGAIIGALFFGKIFQVEIKTFGLIALGLSVWIIYTTDHLRDAKKIRHQASTERHRFHQKHFRTLIRALSLAIALDAISIFYIRRQVFEGGLILLPMVLLYLVVQQYLRFLKEFFIAILYTCGVLLLSVTLTSIEMSITHYLMIFQFGLIAWINLILFSWFDRGYDERDKQNSFVTIIGGKGTCVFLYVLFTLIFLLTLILIWRGGPSTPVAILLMMTIALFVIFIFRAKLARNDLYRMIGDAVFLFPVIYLI
jgi:hypothetical protein